MDIATHLERNKRDIDLGVDTVLVQIKREGKFDEWTDYARGDYRTVASDAAREFKLLDARDGHPVGYTKWRMVDWITREEITF
jgi:hypothetical protein